MSKIMDAKVLGVYPVAPATYYMELEAPDIARLAVPGQFVHVRCSDSQDRCLGDPSLFIWLAVQRVYWPCCFGWWVKGQNC
ncbi:hypothetical protein N752_14825 [Desulforamulus aquiferis]|nr:hypothetical protein [Desulforamulus aquiferis]RYD04643.1 hypothetical protein N752_14825 [Desulforamulus aquiferis]